MGPLSAFCDVVEAHKKRKESPLPMRRRKRDLHARVNGQLRIEFRSERLTSHAGLELFARHLRGLAFNQRLREAFGQLGFHGDYSFVAMIRLFLVLFWTGARRLRHVRFLSHDPMVRRFAGLTSLPEERTLSRWLRQFNVEKLKALRTVNQEIVFDAVRRLKLRTLTLDVDGSVVSTGMQTAWAARGFNPHRRKVPSYYPVLAHLAETSQIVAVKNRPGNVHDGVHAVPFLRDLIRQVRTGVGKKVRLRFRMDGAFFLREVIDLLVAKQCDFALKVPMWRWLDLKPRIQMRTRWAPITDDVSAFEMLLPIPQWNLKLRVVCYRKRVFHETAKNFQLDLYTADDGIYEYSAVATSLSLDPKALWWFMAGRGAQEKTIAELKDGLAFDSIPTKHYAANSAWQWLSILAHNLHRDFQLARREEKRRRSRKATFLYRFESIKTTRFEWLNVAGRMLRLGEGLTLRLASAPEIEKRFRSCQMNT